MDWNALLMAYPQQTDVILGVKILREKIERAMQDVDIPVIDLPCREMEDLTPFVPALAPACEQVWKDLTGAAPEFAMDEALKVLAVKGDVPSMSEQDRERLDAITQNAFSRFLFLLRDKNGRLVPPAWHQGDCPFCGEYARIGFDEEDKRTLHCLSCGHAWRFPASGARRAELRTIRTSATSRPRGSKESRSTTAGSACAITRSWTGRRDRLMTQRPRMH